jgi:hypothetical protein
MVTVRWYRSERAAPVSLIAHRALRSGSTISSALGLSSATSSFPAPIRPLAAHRVRWLTAGGGPRARANHGSAHRERGY